MTLNELNTYLVDLLNLGAWTARDISSNGLQVTRKNQEIKLAAFGVDASLQSFQRAAQMGADILVAVSYTHLDVYKRQIKKSSFPYSSPSTNVSRYLYRNRVEYVT